MSNSVENIEYSQSCIGSALLPGSEADGKGQTDFDHPQAKQMKPLLQELSEVPNSEAMAEVISNYLSKYTPSINDFPCIKNSYSRTILSRSESGMEVLIARWDSGLTSTIHGHPAFAMVYVIAGSLTVEQYEKTESNDIGCVIKTGVKTFDAGNYFYGQGIEGRFDNHIHRIIAAKESLSIHVYSDDALKGEVFSK